jgi:hypothetical protein
LTSWNGKRRRGLRFFLLGQYVLSQSPAPWPSWFWGLNYSFDNINR